MNLYVRIAEILGKARSIDNDDGSYGYGMSCQEYIEVELARLLKEDDASFDMEIFFANILAAKVIVDSEKQTQSGVQSIRDKANRDYQKRLTEKNA